MTRLEKQTERVPWGDSCLWFFLQGEKSSHIYQSLHYLPGCHFIAVGVHGGQDVDACVMDQPRDPLVSGPVLLAEKLRELDEEFTA